MTHSKAKAVTKTKKSMIEAGFDLIGSIFELGYYFEINKILIKR